MPIVSSNPAPSAAPTPAAAEKHGIDWYRSTADDDAAILEERRQRNWEEKQRKKEQKKFNKLFGQWNPQAPHNPSRYSNLRAYKASGGYHRKKEAFNAFLKTAAAKARVAEDVAASNENEYRPMSSSSSKSPSHTVKPSFAPPTSYDNETGPSSDTSGDQAYARQMQLSQPSQNTQTPPPPPPPPSESPHGFPPPPPVADDHSVPPPPPPPLAAPSSQSIFQAATVSAAPIRYANATMSAPPVHYERPDSQMTDAQPDHDYTERPSKRPKISKAEAMMAKMGYKKGQGLGKNNDGVVTHLEVKIRKQPQGGNMLDDDGAKIKSQQVWDVRGGVRKQADEPGKFGEESPVVVTWGCVEGVDWGENADRNDGGIRQEMGEAFSTKVWLDSCSVQWYGTNMIQFGPVEHIQLDERNSEGVVYIHFKSVLSALNAVNRFDEGWEFRGRKIRAKYYDERKFHAGIFDH